MPAETSVVSDIAGRYATALFELARDAGTLDEVAQDLGRIREMIEESEDLARLVRSPVFSSEVQGTAIAAVLERAAICDMVRNFVGVVAENRRLFALRDMIRGFRRPAGRASWRGRGAGNLGAGAR